MRSNKCIGLLVVFAMLLSGCGQRDETIRERIQERCEEITSLYYDLYVSADKTKSQDQWDTPLLPQSSIDAIEELLIDAGLDVLDTNGAYPSYLAAKNGFYEFWDAVDRQETAWQEIVAVRGSGALSYRLFVYQDGVAHVYNMYYPLDDSSDFNYEKHEILDWELTDRGNFYYRIYPAGDKHYADYSLIRLTAPDLELYDLTMKYIWAGGYIGTNIFLTDWTETDFGTLSFNDLWEYLYQDYYGEPFCTEAYTVQQDRYRIPAAAFERVVLSYFDIDIGLLRQLARYDPAGDDYPWRQIQTNDYVFLHYYTVEPEVTAYEANADGTLTLSVEMLSTDLKTDCLFAHEVTVRPLENGQFQFVSNKVTYQTEYGLPFCEPRLTWDKTS